MKRFVKKVLLYMLPVLLYFGVSEYLLYENNETTSINHVINEQIKSKEELYYMRAFFDSSPSLYKLEMVKRKSPDILVLGQSIVLQFRHEMFHPYESAFYNMGYAINNVYDLQSIVNQIQKHQLHKPKLVILGLDLSLVKKTNFKYHINSIDEPHPDEIYQAKFHAAASQLLVKTLYSYNKMSSSTVNDLGYGFWGERGTGYRKDGSMHYAEDIDKYLKHPQYRDPGGYKDLLRNKDYIFTYPYKVDEQLVARVLGCLEKLKAMGIQTVVFIPPISDDFYNYFTRVKDFNRFFNDYLSLQDSLIARKFDIIPFTTPKKAGLSDNYMLDGIHPGEVFVGKLWYNYLNSKLQSGILKQIDSHYLKNLIDAKSTIPLSFMIDTMVFKNHKRM